MSRLNELGVELDRILIEDRAALHKEYEAFLREWPDEDCTFLEYMHSWLAEVESDINFELKKRGIIDGSQ